jgi:hypothetical protein
MKRSTTLILGSLAVCFASLAMAQSTDHTQCRAGTASVLAQDGKKIVMLLDHRGVGQSADAKDPFHGSTQRCIGVLANLDGNVTANGWCKQINPQTGDWLVLDWANGGKPGAGTWTVRHGVGKWQGVTGGGTYESLGATRPYEPGTYQNCVRVQGALKLPG